MGGAVGPLGEADVQRAIVKCLEESPGFRQAFLNSLQLPDSWQSAQVRFESAKQSVHTPNGETDVETNWLSVDGNRLAILCEVKLAAQFMPKQGERYCERSAALVREHKAERAIS